MTKDRWAKHDRMLKMFIGDGYEVFDADKYVFVKQWNGDAKRYQVAVYPKHKWTASQEYRATERINQELDGQLAMRIDAPN